MKLFFESLIIFFATLLAAALVALGEPSRPAEPPQRTASHSSAPAPPESQETFAVVRWLGFR